MTPHRCAVVLLAAAVAAAEPARAQSAGDGFLFKVPPGSWGLRGGFDRALAGGDVFSFLTDQLTLTRGDFSSLTLGTNVAIRVSPSVDVVLDAAYSGSEQRSEFRHWVDQNDLPIEQTTFFRRVPVTLSVRKYVTPRGRSVGRFAWVPARSAYYVGIGAGWMWYRLRQVGDFVDFKTLNVFSDAFQSSAWTPVVHALAGVDFSLGLHIVLTGEGRFAWAKGPVGRDYAGFDHIDLSGLSVMAGLSIRL